MQKRGLSNLVVTVIIILVVIAFVVLIALFTNKSLTQSGQTIDPKIVVLNSEFSLVSATDDGTDVSVVVKKENEGEAFPTAILYDSLGNSVSKSYDGQALLIFQTAVVVFSNADIRAAGLLDRARVEIYASVKSPSGNLISSQSPKDSRTVLRSLLIGGSGFCGDGIIQTPNSNGQSELCDGSNLNGYNCSQFAGYVGGNLGCNLCAFDFSLCVRPPTCGNGIVNSGEECDDNNSINSDSCTNNCMNATCGDAIVWNGHEECDDGQGNNYDSCTDSCQNARCGDGIVWAGQEQCDDGANGNNSDYCYNNCTRTFCGDGFVNPGEQCDGSNLGGGTCAMFAGYIGGNLGCKASCQYNFSSCISPPSCGNGIVEGSEECDDGNSIATDGCVACRSARCGDGIVWNGHEECDDGNTDSSDTCNSCLNPVCGDGITQASNGEQCDDGAGNSNSLPDACRRNCQLPYCGDDVCDSGELFGSSSSISISFSKNPNDYLIDLLTCGDCKTH